MGGGLALQYGLRLERRLAGIFALSSFLGINSCVYEVSVIYLFCDSCNRLFVRIFSFMFHYLSN